MPENENEIEVITDIPESTNVNVETNSQTIDIGVTVPTITLESINTFTPIGPKGEDGRGITSIVKTSTSGLVDTYTVTYTDSTTSTFTVTNGQNGVSVSSITKTSTVGLVDTYTITFSNGTTTTFTVTNGADGEDGEDGEDGYSPSASVSKTESTATITITDKDGTTTASISDGEKGDTGESGVEISTTEPTNPDIKVWLNPNGTQGKTSQLINDSGFITGITSSDVTTALGYIPYNSTNPSYYQTASQVNTTVTSYHDSSKYDASNPNGYTSNTGTITGITMNGASKGTSGVIDLGTVITEHQDISGKENTSNKVTSISSSSTDTQYPSAKCVYEIIGDIETLLQGLR